MPANADQSTGYKLQEEKLTIRDHIDPDKHWIGEALAVPTQTEIAATIGNTSSPGDSPFVARADHLHKLGAGVITSANLAPSVYSRSNDVAYFNNFVYANGSEKIDLILGRCFLSLYVSLNAATTLTPPFNICSAAQASFHPTNITRGLCVIQPDSNPRFGTIQIGTNGFFSCIAIAGGGTVTQNMGIFIQMHWSVL